MSRTESADTVDTPATGSVGVIGLGVMGHAIATRLLDRLGRLDVTDLCRAAADDLVAGGAQFQETAAGVAAQTEVVVLSLNTAPIVEQVVFGAGGVLAGWAARGRAGLIIDMSSIAPDRTASSPLRLQNRAAPGSTRPCPAAHRGRVPAGSA